MTFFYTFTSRLLFRHVLVASIVLRIGLILYSDWHDARSLVKYTDVDYHVFSDAAHFLVHPGPGNRAQGPLKHLLGYTIHLGNPYYRETYRYTPLLALLLTPNDWLHPCFGKYLFAACDIANGYLIYRLLSSDILVGGRIISSSVSIAAASREGSTQADAAHRRRLAMLYSASYLLNPLIFSISTRGSSESVLSFFVLVTLYAALKGHWKIAAGMLGVSTHWKIYPVIYGVSVLSVMSTPRSGSEKGIKAYFNSFLNRQTVLFTCLSAGTFLGLGAVCYAIWGYPFLHESYLYHLHRLDHRHNFSPYFYLTYLTYPSLVPSDFLTSTWSPTTSSLLRSPLTSFIPQMWLALGTGLLFGRNKDNLPFAWFVQTFTFVVFNKVCTSQYFLWYLVLFPLILPNLSVSRNQALLYAGVWIGIQALWLSEAYKLEFLGRDVFLGLWVRGLTYVLGNCWVLVGIMDGYKL